MSGWIIDEDGLVECDCGVSGFQVIVGETGEVVCLECVSCGETYDVDDEFRAAGKRAALAASKR